MSRRFECLPASLRRHELGPGADRDLAAELARRRDAGDRTAVDELVRRNLRLAAWLASRHRAARRVLAFSDRLGFALLALHRAALAYEPDRAGFATFAVVVIKRQLGQEAAKERNARRWATEPLVARSRRVEAGRADVEAAELAEAVGDVIAGLPERDARILRGRFGLGDAPEMSLEGLGSELKITRERVRQVEDRLIEAIGRQLHQSQLDPGWEPPRRRPA
jgi:RNA polymerase primary sigma factor